MPKIEYIDDNGVIISCELIPNNEEAAKKFEETVCRIRCGYKRDADLRSQQRYFLTKGERDFTISCAIPNSPYLTEMIQQLKEKNSLKTDSTQNR